MLDDFTAKDMYDRMILANFQEELDLIAEAADAGEAGVDIPFQKTPNRHYGLFMRWLCGRGFGYEVVGENILRVSWNKSAYTSPSREITVRDVFL